MTAALVKQIYNVLMGEPCCVFPNTSLYSHPTRHVSSHDAERYINAVTCCASNLKQPKAYEITIFI